MIGLSLQALKGALIAERTGGVVDHMARALMPEGTTELQYAQAIEFLQRQGLVDAIIIRSADGAVVQARTVRSTTAAAVFVAHRRRTAWPEWDTTAAPAGAADRSSREGRSAYTRLHY